MTLRRTLDLTPPAGSALHRFAGLEEFLATPPRPGLNEIMIGPRPIHAFFEFRGFPTTFVHFMAALPAKGWDTYPIFRGKMLASKFEMNRLSLSDPNYALPGRPPTGWFCGTEDHRVQEHLAPIIRHFSTAGVEAQAIMFGSSAGGFAALLHGSLIPESVTVTINPRVDLLRMPSQFPTLVKDTFPSANMYTIHEALQTSAGFAFRNGPGNTVAYIQNIQDPTYFEGNLLHFLGLNSNDPRVHLNLVDSGPGHRMPTGTEVHDVLGALVEHAPNWTAALNGLGYHSAPTVDFALKERARRLPSA